MPEKTYRIIFARTARKEIESLEAKVVRRVVSKIQELAVEPRPPGCRKIAGSGDSWRIRVGDYRIIYRIDDQAPLIHVLVVRHRSKAYEWLPSPRFSQ